jgi:hypothetical protein
MEDLSGIKDYSMWNVTKFMVHIKYTLKVSYQVALDETKVVQVTLLGTNDYPH